MNRLLPVFASLAFFTASIAATTARKFRSFSAYRAIPLVAGTSLLISLLFSLHGCSEKPTAPARQPAVIEAVPNTVSFTASAGDPAAKTESISITNIGGGSLTDLVASVSYAANQSSGWLSVSLSGTTAPATLTVIATPGTLATGTYNATITLACASATNSPCSIPISFTVSASAVPRIQLSPASLVFPGSACDGSNVAQTVSITNAGSGSLTGLASSVSYLSSPTGWLTTSLNTTTAPATLTVNILPGTVSATNFATLSISSPAASNSPQTISVSWAGNAACMQASPASLAFSATAGAANPASKSVSITKSGPPVTISLTRSITYTAGQPTGWLSASLGTTTAPATLTVNATTGSLAVGTYTANIAIAGSNAANSPLNVPVTFTVASAAVGPVLDAPTVSGSSVGLRWTYTWTGTYWSTSNCYLLEESTTSSTSGFQEIATYYLPSSPGSPYTTTLTRSPGTYYYRVRARYGAGGTTTAYSAVRQAVVAASARRLRIIDNASNAFLNQVVQVKIVSPSASLTTADLLATDGRCWDLPQSAISIGQSMTFDVAAADYKVFLGIGKWECDMTGLVCPVNSCWWKRTYTTDTNWNNWWVWVLVNVTDHRTGTWDWTLSGLYTSGTLRVTPAGDSPINFNVTNSNPIPGAQPGGIATPGTDLESVLPTAVPTVRWTPSRE